MKSKLETKLAEIMERAGLPTPEREHYFAKPRRWRFDFAWPDRMLAVEVEGGIWVKGAHSRGAHFNSDAEKYNEAALRGWVVLRVTTNTIRSGAALDTIMRAHSLRAVGAWAA